MELRIKMRRLRMLSKIERMWSDDTITKEVMSDVWAIDARESRKFQKQE